MKNPLHYQLSDYDCGPTAMLDALSYLFGAGRHSSGSHPQCDVIQPGLLQRRRRAWKERHIPDGNDVFE